ncbi:MAG: hypothetical protein ACJ8EY_09195 [Sphingomicrobium sp.]
MPDECSQYPGYPKFRTELQHAVAGKSGEALRALFHPTGAMRVNGIGGRASTPDWGFGRPEAETVWAELEEIVALGCASRDGKLYLPAMSAEGAEADQLVVLKSADVHALPRENAPILRSTRHGDRLMAYIHDQPAGWTQVLVKERVGYVRTEAVRSPSSFRLVLVPFEGGWRIREFGDGV